MGTSDHSQNDQLQKQLAWLSGALKALVVAFIVSTNFRLWVVLGKSNFFGQLFESMLDGAALPVITNVFIHHHVTIYVAALVVAGITTFFILKRKSHSAWISVGVVVAISSSALAEIASYAYWLPVQEIFVQLTG